MTEEQEPKKELEYLYREYKPRKPREKHCPVLRVYVCSYNPPEKHTTGGKLIIKPCFSDTIQAYSEKQARELFAESHKIKDSEHINTYEYPKYMCLYGKYRKY